MAGKILANLGLNLDSVRNTVLNFIGDADYGDLNEDNAVFSQNINVNTPKKERDTSVSKSKTSNLNEYSRDLTKLAAQNKLDPVIGR